MGKQIVWSFKTARHEVRLLVQEEEDNPADHFDNFEDIEDIRNGRCEWFMARVQVLRDGKVIGEDILGACAYQSFEDFFASHRTDTADFRNTLANKARGVSIGHYFPDMVRSAISEARQLLAN